jgi:RNA polymerase sigma-70 factor (ECF subfamily)
MDQNTLNELITRSKHNDGNAFRQLVECHQSMIYSLAYRLLCNEEDARDAVQETFIKVWLKLNSFDTSRKFSTWVYAIAANLCYDKLKSGKHFSNCLPAETFNEVLSDDDVEKKMIDTELGAIIATLTDELTPKQKIVFTLSDLEDLQTEEIVQITGMTASQIKSNLFLARQALRKKLNPYQDGR